MSKTFFLRILVGIIVLLVDLNVGICVNNNTIHYNKLKLYQSPEGEILHFTLKNKNGMKVKILNYGATITHLSVPDRYGNFGDVVLGFDSIMKYKNLSNPYFGCIVGRYASRIANAQFVLNNDTFKLTPNNNGNSFGGGIEGFNRKIWGVASITDSSLVLSYLSKDGEEGFPGNLKVQVTYIVSSANELIIDYLASTDKQTPVSLTNHSYFNLSGGVSPTILDHELCINADRFTEVSSTQIPTGRLLEVAGGPMDFTKNKRIGDELEQVPVGYDNYYVLNKLGDRLSLAAALYDPSSGRCMTVKTTQPGIQFYSGNFLNESIIGKDGNKYQKYAGLCLETQYYPDSPNHPEFPSTILYPNEQYHETTIYKFSVK